MVRSEGGRPMGLIRIEASSYKDALKQISQRFGNDVSIVSTRQIRQKGIKGALGATGVEVYVTDLANHRAYLQNKQDGLKQAGLKEDGLQQGSVNLTPSDHGQSSHLVKPVISVSPPKVNEPQAQTGADSSEVGDLSQVIDQLRSQIETLMTARDDAVGDGTTGGVAAVPQEPPVVREARRLLDSRGFSSQAIGDLIDLLRRRRLSHTDGDREELKTIARFHLGELLRAKIPHCMPIKCQKGEGPTAVALIGPTGVGKTTTIAKLASHFHLSQGKKVGLLTLDTYRIGAIDQLRRFSEIMGLELSVVEQGGRTADALAQYQDHDLVFIDTAGRSQRDARKLAEVREMLKGIGSLEVHLCTALGTARETLLDIAQKFQELVPYDRLLITKADESAAHGVLLDLFNNARKPLSYVTCGQEVPHDINTASTERVEKLLLGE